MPDRFLTDLELMVMLAVMRLEPQAYGVSIARELADTAGRDVALPVIYTTLDRLEERGLLTHEIGEPTAARGGRAKKFFSVTKSGVREVRATQAALSALMRGIPALNPSM